jgi:hypothetical protein
MTETKQWKHCTYAFPSYVQSSSYYVQKPSVPIASLELAKGLYHPKAEQSKHTQNE